MMRKSGQCDAEMVWVTVEAFGADDNQDLTEQHV